MIFSEREGFVSPKLLQRDELDEATRNRILNYLNRYFDALKNIDYHEDEDNSSNLLYFLVDKRGQLNQGDHRNRSHILQIVKDEEWYKIFDLLEDIIAYALRHEIPFYNEHINEILEEEKVAYRLFPITLGEEKSFIFTSIVNDAEYSEVKRAANTNIPAVDENINKAILLFSDRKNPDYANAVKESVSAVESLCKNLIKNDDKASLSELFKKLSIKNIRVHPSLQSACKKLYGYASDSDNVRHGGSKPSDITEEEALFMIVTCSAIVNYIKSLCDAVVKPEE